MACKVFLCRSGHVTVVECEGKRSGCNARDCDTQIIKRDWCMKHRTAIMAEFEAQFKRKSILRLEGKK